MKNVSGNIFRLTRKSDRLILPTEVRDHIRNVDVTWIRSHAHEFDANEGEDGEWSLLMDAAAVGCVNFSSLLFSSLLFSSLLFSSLFLLSSPLSSLFLSPHSSLLSFSLSPLLYYLFSSTCSFFISQSLFD